MMRPTRLERRLAKALDPIRGSIDDLTESVDAHRYHTVTTTVAKVEDAERRVAAVQTQAEARVAAVRAELADARKETIANGIADLTARLKWASDARDRFEAKNAEQAGLIAELERRIELMMIERDAARQNADDANLCATSWQQSWYGLEAQLDALAAAVVAVLPDTRRGVEARPRGGSKTKARRRLADLVALVTPADGP